MPSQNKLIKQGLKYTDSLFDEINKRLEQGVRASDTLEAFLEKYHKAFPEGNPLLALGYDAEMVKLILSETNNHKFSRPSQKGLVRVTIESQVGDLIRDVGEDIRDSVRDIVRDGYNDNLSQDEIAVNLTDKVSSIKGRRAKAIARTEIARTATISDYVINAERGATHFYVECRNTACPVCKEAWHKHWSKSNDESFTPSDSSAGGKGWIGDKVYSMSDTMMLPPVHPNCRCVPYFISEDDVLDGVTVEKPTPKPTETTTDSQTKETTLQTSNEIPSNRIISSKEAYSEIINFHSKYGNDNEEHGAIIDLKNGKQYSPMFHGGKHHVNVPESSENGVSYVKTENCSFIHNHPSTAFHAFSDSDINVTLRSEKINHCLAISEKEVWILKTNPDIPQERMPTTFIVNDFKKALSKIQFEHADFKFGEKARLKKEYDEPELSKRLKEFDEYLKSDDYLDMINERLAKEYSKVAKAYEQYLSLERLSIDEVRNYAK